MPKDATGLPRGDSRSLLHRPVASLDPTMASLGLNNSALCSSKRESPLDKPVASPRSFHTGVSRSLTIL